MDWLKKLFVPHEANNFKPHSLQTAAMVGMMVLALITFAVANIHSIVWINSEWLVSAVLPSVVASETNEAREEESLEPLNRSELLDLAAQMKADDMAKNNYFAHWSPTGVSPWHWFDEAGYKYVYAGENLAVHFTDSGEVVSAWLDSPSHRENIMSGKYTEIGIGTAKGEFEGYDTVFVVQMFGRPSEVTRVIKSDPDELVIVSSSSEETSSAAEIALSPSSSPAVLASEDTAELESVSVGKSVDVPEVSTVIYESYEATTSTGTVLATTNRYDSSVTQPTSFFNRLATSPRLLISIVYSIVGLFVMCALTFALAIEWRRHHPIQIAYSAALIVVMLVLFTIHSVVAGGAVIA